MEDQTLHRDKKSNGTRKKTYTYIYIYEKQLYIERRDKKK